MTVGRSFIIVFTIIFTLVSHGADEGKDYGKDKEHFFKGQVLNRSGGLSLVRC